MDILFEFLIDLAFEGTLELSTSRKVPAWIRYPLMILIALFFLAVIGLVFLVGVLMLKEMVLVGIAFIILGVLMTFWTVRKFRRVYLEKREKWE